MNENDLTWAEHAVRLLVWRALAGISSQYAIKALAAAAEIEK